MKNIVLFLPAAFVVFNASAADGTFVGSNIINNVREYVYDLDGRTLLAKDKGVVQFVYNGTVVGAGNYNFILPGIFNAGTISIPGLAGQTVGLTVQIWDKSVAATYEQSTLGRFYIPSQTLTLTLGDASNPASFPPSQLVGFKQMFMVPEPSSVALAALGLGGLILISRRK